MRLRLIAISCIGALIVDLHHHTRSHREPVGGVPITLGRDLPALSAAFTDAGDNAGGVAVDSVIAETGAAGVCKVVGGGETGAAGLWFECQYCLFEGEFWGLKHFYRVYFLKRLFEVQDLVKREK